MRQEVASSTTGCRFEMARWCRWRASHRSCSESTRPAPATERVSASGRKTTMAPYSVIPTPCARQSAGRDVRRNLLHAVGVQIPGRGDRVRLSRTNAIALISAVAICVSACGSTPTSRASGARTAATPQPSGPSGVLEGSVGYPADVNPLMMVYAVATDGSRFYTTEKVGYGNPVPPMDQEWSEYRLMGVVPG